MEALGISEENIYMDKASGANFDRPAYKKMLARLEKDDCIYVHSLDRFGRSYAEIQENWRMLTREKGVDIVVCDMPLLDTRRGKDLLGTFISDMIIQVLSFCADTERQAIKKRQEEGVAAAKLRGVKFGRPESDLPDDFGDLVDRWRRREITPSQALALSGMSKSSFYRKAAAHWEKVS
jgi:DNA invertase Pin-like site-specific DNA recombinase